MADHNINIDARVTAPQGGGGDDFLGAGGELDAQLKKVSLAFGRLSPEARALGMTFRTLINLAESLHTSGTHLIALVGVLGLVYKGFQLLEDHFQNIAEAAKEASDALMGLHITAAGIKANRMLEGGVTAEEKEKATILHADAKFRRENLEDLLLDVDKQSKKSGDPQMAAAKAINTMLKSGLYSDTQVNDIVEKGGLEGLFDDLKKKIGDAASEEKSWKKVLDAAEKQDKKKPEKPDRVDLVKTTWMDEMSQKGLYMSTAFAQGGGYNEMEIMKDQTKLLERIADNTEESKEATYSD